MKIQLINPPPANDDGSVLLNTEDTLKVAMDGTQERLWQGNHAWLMLHTLASAGQTGPFSADDLQLQALRMWDGRGDVPTIKDFELGMRRLLALSVVISTEN